MYMVVGGKRKEWKDTPNAPSQPLFTAFPWARLQSFKLKLQASSFNPGRSTISLLLLHGAVGTHNVWRIERQSLHGRIVDDEFHWMRFR